MYLTDFALLEGLQYFHTLQDLLQSLQTIDAQQVTRDRLHGMQYLTRLQCATVDSCLRRSV